MLSDLLLRRAARSFHGRAVRSPAPRPDDAPIIRSGAAEPLRVLLLGSGITTGWGVRTYGLALVGALQQALQHRLAHPVDAEQVGGLGTLLQDAPALLGSRAEERWDLIVIGFGLNDAIGLTPLSGWHASLDRLLERFDADQPRGLPVPIVLVGVPPTDSLGPTGVLGPLYARHALRLNRATEIVARRGSRTSFVPLPPMANSRDRPEGSPEAYAMWGEVLATHIAGRLRLEDRREPAAATHPRGGLTAAMLDPANRATRRRLSELAVAIQEEVDVDLVTVNLVDGDHLWAVANSTDDRARSAPIAATFCAITLRDDLVLIDLPSRDPRTASVPEHMLQRFDSYAGVALRDAHGRAVGTLCLFNGGIGARMLPSRLERLGRETERHIARLVSPSHGAAIFAQRGTLLQAASSTSPAPPTAMIRTPASTLAFG